MLKKAVILSFCLCLSSLYQVAFAINVSEQQNENQNITLQANSLNLNKAIEIGIINNPNLKVMRSKLGISDAQILQSKLIPNPSIVSDNGFAENTFRIGAEQTIELGNKRARRIKLAKMQKQVFLQELITTTLDVRSEIRTSYIQAYNYQQKLWTAQEILKTTDKLANIAKMREEAGDIANLDVLQAEIKMLNAKNEVQVAKLELNKAFNTLSANLGQDIDINTVLVAPDLIKNLTFSLNLDDNDEKLLNSLINKAYENSSEIKTIQKNIEVENQKLKVARAEIVPNLNIGAGADIVTGDEKKTSAYVMGSFDVPVFNHQQGVIKEINAQKQVYEKELEAQKIVISQKVKNAYSSIVSYSNSIKIYENELIPHSIKVLEKSELSFKEGKSNILVPLNSQDAYINTKFGYIQILSEFEKAISDLERAIGVENENI